MDQVTPFLKQNEDRTWGTKPKETEESFLLFIFVYQQYINFS